MNSPRLPVQPGFAPQHRPETHNGARVQTRTLTATPRAVASNPIPRRAMPVMRRYEITWLGRDGTVHGVTRPAPATAVFEQAFAALARGTLITTTAGPVAVEDLMPGDLLQTREDGPQQLLWIGMMTLFPASMPGQGDCPGPIRIPADSFGPGRPANDVVLGPYARLLHRAGASGTSCDGASVYAPLAEMIDGHSAIRLSPATPVQVYHLGLRRHATICAAGLHLESFHPGRALQTLGEDMLGLYLDLFPHVPQASGFGPLAHPQQPHPDRASRSDAA